MSNAHKNPWDVFSDALRSPVATLAASDLALVLVIAFAFLSDQKELAFILSAALIFALLITLVAIIKMKRVGLSSIRHSEPEFIKGSREVQQDPGLAVCRRGNSGGLLPTILHKTCQ